MHAEMAELSKFAEEIMVEILSRLPPKSLMRFKCVRKSWQCLINNSNFQTKHLSVSKRNKHPSNPSSSVTIVFNRQVNEDVVHSGKSDLLLALFHLSHGLEDGDDHELHPILENLHNPLAHLVNEYGVNISCHCDGILCLTDHGKTGKYMVLCNPAIKEFKLLPVPSSNSSSTGDGFGYDLKSKDYKVVRILYNGEEGYRDGLRKRVVIHPPRAVVYSLLTSSWKEIKVDNLITKSTIYWPQFCESTNSIYRNGILYWCGREGFRQENYIVGEFSDTEEDDLSELKNCTISFDLGNETFHVILAPDDCNLVYCGIGLWKESSIAFCTLRPWNRYSSEKEIREIWVMDDLGGGEGSWTKYLTLTPVVELWSLKSQKGLFWYNKQLVTVFKNKGAVIFQDVFTNKFKRLPLKEAGLRDYSEALECTMSIVSIGGAGLDSHDDAAIHSFDSGPSSCSDMDSHSCSNEEV